MNPGIVISSPISYNEAEASYKKLTFTDDFMFGKVLIDNPDICKGLVELVTGRKVKELTLLQEQYSIRLLKEAKGVRFDVVFAGDDQVYDFEMQTTKEKNASRRVRYYQSTLDAKLLKKGDDCALLPDTCIVFFCLKDPFGLRMPVYTFEQRCEENNDLLLNNGTKTIFLNATSDKKKYTASSEIWNFLSYLQDEIPKDALTRSIDRAVKTARDDELGRKMYMTLLERDKYNWDQGMEEGKKIGMQEGHDAGLEEGLVEGRDKEYTRMKSLMTILDEEEREADKSKVFQNKDFYHQLLQEYGIQ